MAIFEVIGVFMTVWTLAEDSITVYCAESKKLGVQMRSVICLISVLMSGFVLVACGQSGALQLPSDPNYDKRAKYLLYKQTSEEKTAKQEPTQNAAKAPAQP